MSIFSEKIISRKDVKDPFILEEYIENYAKKSNKRYTKQEIREICKNAINANRTLTEGILWGATIDNACGQVNTLEDVND